MSDFDKQVMLDIFLTPTTYIMEVVGIGAAGLAGLEFIGPWGYLVGLVGILGGVGWGITRVILDPGKVAEESIQKRKDRERQNKEKEFDLFDKKIVEEKDPEVRKEFRALRSIHKEFLRRYPDIMESIRDDMETEFMELMEINFEALRRAHENLMTIRQIEVDKIKKPFKEKRTKALEKVRTSTQQLTDFVVGLAEEKDSDDERSSINRHNSLKNNLDIMRQVQEEMNEFMTSRVTE